MAPQPINVRAAAFIAAATTTHGDKYDYRLVPNMYRSAHGKVTIICPLHGTFNQTPASHQKGQGCPDCGGRVGASVAARRDRFVSGAIAKHGNRYDYTEVVFVDQRTEVTIGCRDHGAFRQRPTNHVSGRGCPTCAHADRTAARVPKLLGAAISQSR